MDATVLLSSDLGAMKTLDRCHSSSNLLHEVQIYCPEAEVLSNFSFVTECPRSVDPIYIVKLLYKMGHEDSRLLGHTVAEDNII